MLGRIVGRKIGGKLSKVLPRRHQNKPIVLRSGELPAHCDPELNGHVQASKVLGTFAGAAGKVMDGIAAIEYCSGDAIHSSSVIAFQCTSWCESRRYGRKEDRVEELIVIFVEWTVEVYRAGRIEGCQWTYQAALARENRRQARAARHLLDIFSHLNQSLAMGQTGFRRGLRLWLGLAQGF